MEDHMNTLKAQKDVFLTLWEQPAGGENKIR